MSGVSASVQQVFLTFNKEPSFNLKPVLDSFAGYFCCCFKWSNNDIKGNGSATPQKKCILLKYLWQNNAIILSSNEHCYVLIH